MSVPTNLIPTKITGLPEYTGSSTAGYMPYVLNGQTFKVQFSNIAAVGAVPSSRTVAAGTGLTGGGDLSVDRVISIAAGGVGFDQLAASGVVAGTYGSGSAVPVVEVDAKGRVVSASTTPLVISGYVPDTRTVTAGAGLIGGGALSSDISLAVNFSSATPQALGTATAGVSTAAAREDHVHPAVDLSDTNQTQGALPLGRGGTGDALSPVAGAVVYSTGTKFALTNPGSAGQVLTSTGTDEPVWTTIPGTGTVTSIDVSGGATGLTFSGGPITIAGTITMAGTLAIASGGTGATTASGARTNLEAAKSGANSDITSLSGITGGISTPTFVAFNTSGSTPPTLGQLRWNTDDGTLDLGLNGGAILKTGQQTLYYAKNTSGSSIPIGTPVMFTGTVGASGKLTFGLAVADGSVPAEYMMGVATQTITNNGFGYVTDFGVVRGFDTSGTPYGEVWADGDLLYFDPAAPGTWTNVEPVAPNIHIPVAVVLTAASGGSGSIFVRMVISESLNELQDVYINGTGTPLAGQVLIYDATQARWENHHLTAGANVSITNGDGSITIASSDQFTGTVTSVAASGGTTGLTFSGSPITTSGTLTLGGTLAIASGGTGATTASGARTALDVPSTSGSGATGTWAIDVSGTASNVTGVVAVANGGTGQTTYTDGQLLIGNSTGNTLSKATLTAGTNIAITNGPGSITISATGGTGTVTSIDVSGGTTGLTFSGGPITSSGTITMAGTLAIANGGTGATTAAGARTALDVPSTSGSGATGTWGISITGNAATVTNGVYTTGSYADPAWITSLAGSKITGNISGNAANVTGVVAVANGGTGATSLTSGYVLKGNGTSPVSASAIYDDGTNIGIGTSSPGYKLSVAATGTISGEFRTSGAINALFLADAGTTAETLYIGTVGNDFRVVTGSNERMRIDSSGNVGIGTTSPTARISVLTGSNYAATFNTVTTSASSTAISIGGFSTVAGGGGGSVGIRAYHHHANTALSSMAFEVSGSTEAMRIDTSGNVGIGTSTPSAKLHVSDAANGKVLISGTSTSAELELSAPIPKITFTDTSGSAADGEIKVDGNAMQIAMGGSERMRITSAGRVGIGTSSPATPLVVSSGGASGLEFDPSGGLGTGPYIQAYDRVAAVYKHLTYFAAVHTWYNDNTRVMDLVSGNLGIGTTTPGAKLDILGASSDQLRLRTAGTEEYRIGRNASTGLLDFYGSQSGFTGYVFGGVDGERMRIDSSGNLGIGTSSPTGRLSVNSTSSTGTSISAWTSAYSVFGPNAGSSTGAALGLGYNTATDTAEIVSIAPNVAWKNMRLAAVTMDLETISGRVQTNQSFRAPIFYDSDDTGFFVDPNSTSVMSSITVNTSMSLPGGSAVFSNGDIVARRSIGATGVYYFVEAGNKYLFWDGGTYVFGPDGPVLSSQSFRAPIFYDSANTAYYVDPAATGAAIVVNGYMLGGLGAQTTGGTLDWNDTNNARSGSTQTLLLGTATNGPGGGEYFHPFNFEFGAKDGSGQVTQFAVSYASPANKLYMRGRYLGSWTSWVQFLNSSSTAQTKTGTLQSDTDFRAPIFYDSNNTARYVDPASETVIETLTIFGEVNLSAVGINYVDHSGTILFRNQSGFAASASLTTGGDFVAAGNITAYGSPSDINLKENIENIPNALEKLLTLNGVNFNYKKDGSRSTGVIAQEVEKVLPEVVYEATNADCTESFKAVRYGNMVGLLIEAIKELTARVAELEGK